MDASEVELLAESNDVTVVGSALLRAGGKPATATSLYVGLSAEPDRVDKQRPIILVPRSGEGACVVDQRAVREALGVLGPVDAAVTLSLRAVPQEVRERYHVLVHCPPRRKVPAGVRVVTLQRPGAVPFPPSSAAPAPGGKAAAKASSKRALESLAAFLDEDDAEAAAAGVVAAGAATTEPSADEAVAIDGLDEDELLLLPRRVAAAPAPPPAKKGSRKEDAFAAEVTFRASGGGSTGASTQGRRTDPFATWGEELTDAPAGTRWFRPHAHVLASYLAAGDASPTDAGASKTAPILFVVAEGGAIRTSMFARGADAFAPAHEGVATALAEAHAVGYRVCLIDSYPALDRAPRSAIDECLGRLANFHQRTLQGATPFFAAVSVAGPYRRSEHTLPNAGLISLAAALASGGNPTVPKGSAVVGAARPPADGRDEIDTLLEVVTPDRADAACAKAAGIPFVPVDAFCRDGVAALGR